MTGRPDGFALVTGATAGLGAEFSRLLAAEGRDLVLVARDGDRLEKAAAGLAERHSIEVEVLAADLSTENGRAHAADRIRAMSRPVDTLVNNAGFGLGRAFGSSDLGDEQRLLDVNVRAVLELTHAAVGAMRPRGRGEILNVSSAAGFIPRGGGATYAAGKAWVTSFTEGLSWWLRGSGVNACAVCPGFVRTEFHQRAGMDMRRLPGWMWLDAGRVATEALADLRAGKRISVPSKRYRALLLGARLLPRSALGRITAAW